MNGRFVLPVLLLGALVLSTPSMASAQGGSTGASGHTGAGRNSGGVNRKFDVEVSNRGVTQDESSVLRNAAVGAPDGQGNPEGTPSTP